MKTCKRCMCERENSEFYAHKEMSDGLLNICKPCIRESVKRRRKANIQAARAYDRNRPNAKERTANAAAYLKGKPELKAKAIENYFSRYPEKRDATVAVGNALRDGRLVRQPCEVCGEARTEGHHDDYSKALEVRWLCRLHHAEHHKRERERQREVAA